MAGDTDLTAMLIDWEAFWAKDHTEAEWIAQPLIPAHRSVALFAPGGARKSLLTLWMIAAIATGRPIFGNTQPPRHVLYLDYEMTEDDLAERLETMGYGGQDLTHLHYALLPSLAALDTREGGEAVLRLAELVEAELVIIDTFGRAVHGPENDADTVRAWYRWTGLHLKAAGRAFWRIDHAGKDLAKGQRGNSAKNDDVDIVWQMTVKDDNHLTLTARKRRMGWIPETVNLHLDDSDELTFTLTDQPGYVIGTTTTAELLEQLGAPLDISTRQAVELLRASGNPTRRAIVVEAVKHRRQVVENLLNSGSQTAGTTPPTKAVPDHSGTFYESKPNTLLDELGTIAGTTGTTGSGVVVPEGSPPKGGTPDHAPAAEDPLADF
jgi:hypothetical protein